MKKNKYNPPKGSSGTVNPFDNSEVSAGTASPFANSGDAKPVKNIFQDTPPQELEPPSGVENEYLLGFENGVLGMFICSNNYFICQLTFDCLDNLGAVSLNVIETVCRAFGIKRAIGSDGGIVDVMPLLDSLRTPERQYSVIFKLNGVEISVDVKTNSEDGQEITGEAVSNVYNEMGISLPPESIANALIVEKSDAGS
jgi:hypothetical protein